MAFLNEKSARNERAIVDSEASAFYLHVDDGVVLADHDVRANATMHQAANSLQGAGFTVDDRTETADVLTLVGYELVKKPAILRYPLTKAAKLRSAMRWIVTRPVV